MKALTLYWIVLGLGLIITVASGLYLIHNDLVAPIGIAGTLALCLMIVIKYSPSDQIQISKHVKTQLVRWFWYNLLIFPVLMAFYIPYNIFWLNYTPLQILKFVATNGFFGAIVNFILRPWNAYITRFIKRREEKKALNTATMPSTGEQK